MSALTPKQTKALAFIRDFIAEKGWPPSFDEIMIGLGLKSKSPTHRIIHALVDRGAISFLPGRARSITINEQRPTDSIEFLPDHLAVWVRVVAAKAGVTPLQVITECVRDGYTNVTGRNGEQKAPRETSVAA